MANGKRTNNYLQNTTEKKLKIKNYEPNQKPGMISCAPEG